MNNKGQALIELTVICGLVIGAVLVTVRMGLASQLNLAIDEFIESAHLCELQRKPACQAQFNQKLADFNLKKISTRFELFKNTSFISVQAETELGKVFAKESELHLELEID